MLITVEDYKKLISDLEQSSSIGRPSTIFRTYGAGRFAQIYTDNIVIL